MIYENGAVSRILTEEGYITFAGTTPAYLYYLKDHQGNNRVVIDQYDSVKQVNHYYPFGGLFGDTVQLSNQPYKYNGKELDRMHGLDLFDYGARHYDAAIGRWGTVDPLAEKYYSISPYVYCAGNPIAYRDENGEWINLVIGAVVGAVTDYGLQVATNYMTGVSGPDAWTKVDMKSIGVSTIAGATGVGLGAKVSQVVKVAKLGKAATQVAKVAGEAVVDASISAGSQLVQNGEVNLVQVAVDTGAGVVGSKLGDNAKIAKQSSPEGKRLARQADRSQRVAGDNARASRTEAANKATKAAENYGNAQAAATSVATSSTISKTTEKIEKYRKNH